MTTSTSRLLLCCHGFVASVLLATSSFADSVPTELTAAQIREDLAVLRDQWSQQDRSFSVAAREHFDKELQAVAARADRLTPAEFTLEVARLVAIGGNGHSALSMPDMPALPIRVWWFSDGLHVVSAHPEHADLVGVRIERVGDTPADEALRLVAMFIPGNEEHQRVEAPRFLTNPLALRRAGVIRNSKKVGLTVIDAQQRRRAVSLDASLPVAPLGTDTWTVLVPQEPTTADRWPHVLDALTQRPQAFTSVEDLSYEWLSTSPRVLYLRSNQISSDDDVRLDMKLLELTAKELVPQPVQAVIVDLRYNMGGNFTNTILFSQMLPELVAPDGRVLVLTGPVTFSAAIVTASMLKMHGGQRVMFVGEHMGDDDQFWAEGRMTELPHSRLPVRYSDYFHDWAAPCRAEHCLWATRIFGPKAPVSLQPDVPASTSFSDYAAGVDAVLKRARELVSPSASAAVTRSDE